VIGVWGTVRVVSSDWWTFSRTECIRVLADGDILTFKYGASIEYDTMVAD